MSTADDIKAEIAAINAKVDRLITGIPERHLQYVNHPNDAARRIDELEAEVGETADIKSALDALNAKLDDAIAAGPGRYAAVDGVDVHASKPGKVVTEKDVRANEDTSLDPNNPALTPDALAQAKATGAATGQP